MLAPVMHGLLIASMSLLLFLHTIGRYYTVEPGNLPPRGRAAHGFLSEAARSCARWAPLGSLSFTSCA